MLKTTTKWKKLTTWWSWACSPQTYWCLRIDNVNRPVTSTSTNQRIVHVLITYPATPLPYLAFKNALLKPFSGLGFWGAWATCLLAWSYNKPFSAPNSDISVLFGLTCVTHTNLRSVTYPMLDEQRAQNLQQAHPNHMSTLPGAPDWGTGLGGLKHLWGCGSELPEKGNQTDGDLQGSWRNWTSFVVIWCRIW